MKNYKKPDGSVWAYELDGSQDFLITEDMVALTDAEAIALLNPVLPVPIPATLTMRQARLILLSTGRLAAVNYAIASLPSPQKEAAQIEWEYSNEVHRDSALITTLAAGLQIDSSTLDALFTQGSLL